jgi:hypothetical protein
MDTYTCRGCAEPIPHPVDDAGCYCDLCMALILFDLERKERERHRLTGG